MLTRLFDTLEYIFHDTNLSYQTQNLTIWEAYEELSYKYESDFIIEPN